MEIIYYEIKSECVCVCLYVVKSAHKLRADDVSWYEIQSSCLHSLDDTIIIRRASDRCASIRNSSCMFAGTRGFMLHMILCELCEPKSSSYTSHVWVLTQWRSARSPNLEQTAYKFSVCNVWAANFRTTKSSERKANSWIIQSANQIHKQATYYRVLQLQ